MASSDGIIELSLKVQQVQFRIEGADGTKRLYTLRELDGRDRDKFQSLLASKTELGPDGKPSKIKNVAGVCGELLATCLYDDAGKLVPAPVVDAWPSRVTDVLSKKALALSGLVDEEADLLAGGASSASASSGSASPTA